MGHIIYAFVGAERVMRRAFDLCAPLGAGLVLVPLDESLADALAGGPDSALPPFERLTPRALATVLDRIGDAPFGYIETEYFGGMGGQRGAAWKGARDLVTPNRQDGIVNAVLRALGVVRAEGRDEWDTVDLVRFRSNDDIVKAAQRSS
ncbi:MAG: hypothetical protein ACM31C_03620 [Acidobacteriota bacterium]